MGSTVPAWGTIFTVNGTADLADNGRPDTIVLPAGGYMLTMASPNEDTAATDRAVQGGADRLRLHVHLILVPVRRRAHH